MAGLNSERNAVAGSRLIGWLVSYGLDSQGASYEIRAGRLLIGSAPATDVRTIAITERTVSSPHLAVSASRTSQVLIQDIFSEHGTFITKAGSGNEEKVLGPTPIHHGDWIRVGEKIRFQVCLLEAEKN